MLFDLDDTFLDEGKLTVAAYGALSRLSQAGLRLLAVTGRPAGWGEVMARQWPVDGVVTENGAVALYRDGRAVRRWHEADEPTRKARRERILAGFASLQERFRERPRVRRLARARKRSRHRYRRIANSRR